MTEIIEPLSTVALPALSGDEWADLFRVANRYEPAYEALVAALYVGGSDEERSDCAYAGRKQPLSYASGAFRFV